MILTSHRAWALGVGVEAGAVAVEPSAGGESAVWGLTGGIVVDQRIQLWPIFLDPWLDLQLPLPIDLQSGHYLAIDLGLRLGIALGPVEPWIGGLGQLNLLLNQAESEDGRGDFAGGFGGNVGVDFILSSVRLGIEGRAVYLPVIWQGDFGQAATELQLLATARYVF